MDIVWREKNDPAIYEAARTKRLFNAQVPDRYPLAIAFVESDIHIVDAVRLAIDQKCQISVRAGGHSFPAWSVCENAILVDLGNFSEIVMDDETGVVGVTPATTSRKLNEFLSVKGRIASVGHCPDVGLGGFLLAGGLGWNSRNWGWACEQIVAVDVVTPGGELLRADREKNTELFWAVRGGGPAFPGIITRFYLQTRPAPRRILSSVYVYPVTHCGEAFSWILDIGSELRGNIEISAVATYVPEQETPCLIIKMMAFGDEEESVKQLQRAENSYPPGSLSHSFCQETTLQNEFDNMEIAFPSNHRYCVDNAFLRNDIDVAALLQTAFTTLPSKKSMVLWNFMMPRSQRELLDMALSIQSNHYCAVYAIWEDESEDGYCRSWVQTIMRGLETHSIGSYVGEYDFQARACNVWGAEQYERLKHIKQKWDPHNRMCPCPGLRL
ncbi:hypothetical protein P175DRAFT_0492612 [Aspergillus ochraceoroseus IBT 24754]|uniref:FAD-binding PCMH-type domain-containing protein n=2 Tax=Aspergillus ochraceoroseus TaxID=138278 RepID=A0A2T5M0F0_9EURO|nr:uncharacterized protein P175DRAFT_0492612 [Aspergillus ochraceoroseus IBT 24754]KKK13638.1 hypothetical protein AOCH_003263 [Aspergillus ochraceoroseus]PTU22003.1 hypothetical protein P175DRAFT_0492612 [Aspergillus ochraceoroseus IBT 24754]